MFVEYELTCLLCEQIRVDAKRHTCQMQVQEPWGDKSNAAYCFYCHSKFTTFKEKHRCKCCGYVFCAACTPKACRRCDRGYGLRDAMLSLTIVL